MFSAFRFWTKYNKQTRLCRTKKSFVRIILFLLWFVIEHTLLTKDIFESISCSYRMNPRLSCEVNCLCNRTSNALWWFWIWIEGVKLLFRVSLDWSQCECHLSSFDKNNHEFVSRWDIVDSVAKGCYHIEIDVCLQQTVQIKRKYCNWQHQSC